MIGNLGRATRSAAAALLTAASVAACAATSGPVGAPTEPPTTGPHPVSTAALPSIPPPPPSHHTKHTHSPASPAVLKALTASHQLTRTIDTALTRSSQVAPGVRVVVPSTVAGQLLVEWSVGRDLPDPGVRGRLRSEGLTILQLVKASKLRYGVLQLLALGPYLVNGKKKVSIVIRARFTQKRVATTNWVTVAPSAFLRMPDARKPFVEPSYR